MVSIVPILDREQIAPSYVPEVDEQKRSKRVHPRIQQMLDHREPYLPGMKRALLNYEGISRQNPDDPRDEMIVMPMARIFVEAKTAEEVKAINDYEFIPVADSSDTWKVELLKDVNDSVKRKVKYKPKRHQLLRMKNLMGVSIARLGYRRTMRMIKQRIEEEETGMNNKWKEVEVPIYDDIFMDVISPLDFAIDPNSTTMDDAMDCVHFHMENYAVFLETYLNDKRFKNVEKVTPGKGLVFDNQGNMRPLQSVSKDMVGIWEYFNKIRDEWIIYANGIEILYFPLPDDHKELPFVSYHNNPAFVTSYVNYLYGTNRSPNSGKELAYQEAIIGHEHFWTKGDPETIRDLIEMDTGFFRAKFRREKLSGELLVTTKGSYRMAERNWRSGDQVIGGMGNVEVLPLSTPGAAQIDETVDKIFEIMVLCTGVDPRNLADDQKDKTATESAIQRESAMKRIEQGIEYNEENGDTRFGMIIHKLIQQYYTKPLIIRLTGLEDKDELDTFDKVEHDPETGKPLLGKRHRRIRSSRSLVEVRFHGKKHLKEESGGVTSFLATPEFIRTSEVEIAVSSGTRQGQLRAITLQQSQEALNMTLSLIQVAQPSQPGVQPPVSMDDLPNIKYCVEQYVRALGWNPDLAIGQAPGGKKDKDEQEQDDAMKQYAANRHATPIVPPPQPPQQPQAPPSPLNAPM